MKTMSTDMSSWNWTAEQALFGLKCAIEYERRQEYLFLLLKSINKKREGNDHLSM
jgi:hypothetical protein